MPQRLNLHRLWTVVAISLIAILVFFYRVALQQPSIPFASVVAIGRPNSSGIIPLTLAVDVRTRRVFVADAVNNMLTVLDADRDVLLRQVSLGVPTDASTPLAVVVDDRRNRVYTAGNATINIFDARNGKLVRTLPGFVADPQGLAVDDATGHLIVAGAGNVSAVDIRRGKVLYSATVGQPLSQLFATVTRGRVIVASKTDHWVTFLDARTGHLLHRTTINVASGVLGNLTSLSVDQRTGRAFVGLVSGAVGILSCYHGSLIRLVRMSSSSQRRGVPYVVALDEQVARVLVATGRAGIISLLDGANGHLIKVLHVGSWPYVTAVDSFHRRAFVLDAVPDGNINILDIVRGQLLQTVHYNANLYAIAVDDHTGRVFVAASGGSEAIPDPWQRVRQLLPFLPLPAPPRTRSLPPRVMVFDVPRVPH